MFMTMTPVHRYLREVDLDLSRHICSQNIHIDKARVLVTGTNKAGGTTRQVGWFRQAGLQGRWVRSIDVPALTANIFAAATNRTNIHKRTGTMRH
jgi:hypothetical protein